MWYVVKCVCIHMYLLPCRTFLLNFCLRLYMHQHVSFEGKEKNLETLNFFTGLEVKDVDPGIRPRLCMCGGESKVCGGV
jgi:hypothetical protein